MRLCVCVYMCVREFGRVCFTAFWICSRLKHSPIVFSPSLFEVTLSFPLPRSLAHLPTCLIIRIPVLFFLIQPVVYQVIQTFSVQLFSSGIRRRWTNIYHPCCATLVGCGTVWYAVCWALVEIRLFHHQCPLIILKCFWWQGSSLSSRHQANTYIYIYFLSLLLTTTPSFYLSISSYAEL